MLVEFLNFYFSTGEFFTKALFFFILIYGIIILFKVFIGEDDKKTISRFPIIILIILVIGSFGISSFTEFENGYRYHILKIEYPSFLFRAVGERDIYYFLKSEQRIFRNKEDLKNIRIKNNSKLNKKDIKRLSEELESLKFEKENINNFLNEILKSEIKTQIDLYTKNLTSDEIKEVKKEIKSFKFNEENAEELLLILRLYKEKLKDKVNKSFK